MGGEADSCRRGDASVAGPLTNTLITDTWHAVWLTHLSAMADTGGISLLRSCPGQCGAGAMAPRLTIRCCTDIPPKPLFTFPVPPGRGRFFSGSSRIRLKCLPRMFAILCCSEVVAHGGGDCFSGPAVDPLRARPTITDGGRSTARDACVATRLSHPSGLGFGILPQTVLKTFPAPRGPSRSARSTSWKPTSGFVPPESR